MGAGRKNFVRMNPKVSPLTCRSLYDMPASPKGLPCNYRLTSCLCHLPILEQAYCSLCHAV